SFLLRLPLLSIAEPRRSRRSLTRILISRRTEVKSCTEVRSHPALACCTELKSRPLLFLPSLDCSNGFSI
ncbi:hypothetical protein LINPERPRIM_LOCUS37847, partial [Linum perenne]